MDDGDLPVAAGTRGCPAAVGGVPPPSSNASMLINSRSKEAAARLAGSYKSIKEVPAMDEDQGVQLLRNKLLDNKPDAAVVEDGAAELVHVLDCMPFAIS